MDNAVIGNFLTERRKSLGYTQKFMAERCGVSQQTLCNYELGKRSIQKGYLPKIAAAYELPFMVLIRIMYGNSFTLIESENLIPEVNRLISAGVKEASFLDICKLLEIEKELGFRMEEEQLKIWWEKQITH